MNPGLIATVKWIGEVTRAEIKGNEPQSDKLIFLPKQRASYKLINKEINISSGSMTASSVLLFQGILPVLLYIGGNPKGSKPIELRLDGATNCLDAPSYEYLDQVFLPALEDYFGIKVGRKMERRGWAPMTSDTRTVQKGTIRFKFMPLEWNTTLKPRQDAKLCDVDQEDLSAANGDGQNGYGSRSIDNNIIKVVATIITPEAMHEPLKEALEEDIEYRFPDADVAFTVEDSHHTDRVYILLVAHAEHCRWGRDIIKAERLKDANVVSLAKDISSKLAADLEKEVGGEVGGDCPIDSFLQDQLVVFQCLAEGRTCFPRQMKNELTEAALQNLHPAFPLSDDSLWKLRIKKDESNDSQHTHSARYAGAMMLPTAKWCNEGKVCLGAAIKAPNAPPSKRKH